MTGRLRTSRAGLDLIKSFEGFRDAALRLPDGRWMIGYGHVRTAREGLRITEKDAEDLLAHDLKPVEEAIHAMVYSPLNQNQFDALVSLGFNISPARLKDSDIVRNLNAGDYLAASCGFDIWRKARMYGRLMVVDVLARRRAAEKAMFMEHPDGRPTAPSPLVVPEADMDVGDTGMGSRPPTEGSASPEAGSAPTLDMADAVRRLAERAQGVVSAAGRPVPPAALETASNDDEEEDFRPHTPPRTKGEIEQAQRLVAERLARILERAERSVAEEKPRAAPAPAPAIVAAAIKAERSVQETPAQQRANGRALIDDTEMFNPGRDPASMFAEAERNAQIVNGRAQHMGLINTRLITLLPWVLIFILSALGFGIGAVDTFGAPGVDSGARSASTVLAVFGMLVLMSVYFIVTRASSESDG